MNNLKWISEIDDAENIIKSLAKKNAELSSFLKVLFNPDSIDRFIELYENFGKTDFKFSWIIINELMKKYVEQYYYRPVNVLAVKLGVHSRTIYSWLAELKKEGNLNGKSN